MYELFSSRLKNSRLIVDSGSISEAFLKSWFELHHNHYDDVIMTMLASQITSLKVVYSIVYSGVNQRKHQSSASLAFVREIHRGPVNFPHKWPVTRKMFPFDDVIMLLWFLRCGVMVCYMWGLDYLCGHPHPRQGQIITPCRIFWGMQLFIHVLDAWRLSYIHPWLFQNATSKVLLSFSHRYRSQPWDLVRFHKVRASWNGRWTISSLPSPITVLVNWD